MPLPLGRPRPLTSLCLYPMTSKMQLNKNTERPSLCLCPISISKGSEGSARNFTCRSSGNFLEFGKILLRFFPLYSMYIYSKYTLSAGMVGLNSGWILPDLLDSHNLPNTRDHRFRSITNVPYAFPFLKINL